MLNAFHIHTGYTKYTLEEAIAMMKEVDTFFKKCKRILFNKYAASGTTRLCFFRIFRQCSDFIVHTAIFIKGLPKPQGQDKHTSY